MSVRLDQERFYSALDRQRSGLGLTWRQLGRHLEISPSTFSRLGQGHRPDVDTFVKVLDWLEMPAEAFMSRADGKHRLPTTDPLTSIATVLRLDPALRSEDVTSLEQILSLVYHRLRRVEGSELAGDGGAEIDIKDEPS